MSGEPRIRAICNADDFVIGWAAQRFSDCPTSRAKAIGIADGDRLIAACVYSDMRHNHRGQPVDIRMTLVAESPRWALRTMVRFLFRYPFELLGVVRVTAIIGRRNKRSRKLVEGMGFRLEGVHRRAYDGTQDAMSYGMLRSECRWIGNGKEVKRQRAAAG